MLYEIVEHRGAELQGLVTDALGGRSLRARRRTSYAPRSQTSWRKPALILTRVP